MAGLMVAAALAALPQAFKVEPGVSMPLDSPTIAYANRLLHDARVAVAARKIDLTCTPDGGFAGADSCEALHGLFRVMDQRDFVPDFVGPCYGGAPTRCISFQHRRDQDSYIHVMIRLEPAAGSGGELEMASVEIGEGQYTSD